MSKGSWDRSDPIKKDQAEYWKPENVMRRKAERDGWTDIHGGDNGAYWRGINPETNKCEKLPKKYTKEL